MDTLNTSSLDADLAEVETLLQLSSRSSVRGWLAQLHTDLRKRKALMELAAQGSANGYSQGSSREGFSNGYRPSSDIFNTSTSSPPAGPGSLVVDSDGLASSLDLVSFGSRLSNGHKTVNAFSTQDPVFVPETLQGALMAKGAGPQASRQWNSSTVFGGSSPSRNEGTDIPTLPLNANANNSLTHPHSAEGVSQPYQSRLLPTGSGVLGIPGLGGVGASPSYSDVEVLPALQYGISVSLPAKSQYRPLTTCSWEQNETMVKVYVPLRGVQTENLRSVFDATSVLVKAVNLQGKDYVFVIKPTFRAINPDGCIAVASKTKKNILITIQKLNARLPEEKHWRDIYLKQPTAHPPSNIPPPPPPPPPYR